MNNEGTKKENIGWTYKGCEGYHSIFGYLGAEGYLLSRELRPGSRHCQKGTPEFLRRMLEGLLGEGSGRLVQDEYKVDFPAPFSPQIACISPDLSSTFISFRGR
jgi:hypothetical protein